MTKYVDVDALVEYLDKQLELITGSEGYYSQYAQGYEMATIDVDKFPAADVVEVKHGRWILHDDGSATCDQCRVRQKNIWDYDNEQHFCGNCGAKMDKEGV